MRPRRSRKDRQAQTETYRTKYGNEFINDVYSLTKPPFPTLQSVADRYGITRQAVHLIFPLITGQSYSQYVAARRKMHREGKMLVVEQDPRQKLLWSELCGRSMQSAYCKAWTAQVLLEKECRTRNLPFSHEGKSRVAINGKRAVVRMAASKSKTSPSSIVQYYRCSVPPNLKDLLICRVEPRNEWWVFSPKDLNGHTTVYIPDHPARVQTSYRNKIRRNLEAWRYFHRKGK